VYNITVLYIVGPNNVAIMQGKLFAQSRGCQAGPVLMMTIVALIATNSLAVDDQQSFGEQQLSQILEDRTTMKGILDGNDFINEWVIRQFDGNCPNHRVHWDTHEPYGGRDSEYQPAYGTTPGSVRVTKSEKISGRDKWLLLIFELYNVKNSNDYIELSRRATAGEIDRKNYSIECTAFEFHALVRTQKFFRCHPLPGATAESDPNYIAYLKGVGDFDDYQKMLDSQAPGEYDPRDYYSKGFDSLQPGSIASWVAWFNSRDK
jgi:hypothetical protein